MTVEKEWLDFLRDQYPKGSGIRLSQQRDALSPVEPGSRGRLEYIDDEGQFHVRWEDGKETVLAIGKDRFQVLPPEPQTLKFYMPLTATFRSDDTEMFGLSTTDHGYVARNGQEIICAYSKPEHGPEMTM